MLVAGIDEAGRGCIAGPVVAAAVIIDDGGFPDSKKISAAARERFYEQIQIYAEAISICAVSPFLVDRLNIRHATLLAMRCAVRDLDITPSLVLVDGRDVIPALGIEQRAIIDGDALDFRIGAASIIAKVSRDRLMRAYAQLYAAYSLDSHKGYGTRAHYDEIAITGITCIHRRSFRLFDEPKQLSLFD